MTNDRRRHSASDDAVSALTGVRQATTPASMIHQNEDDAEYLDYFIMAARLLAYDFMTLPLYVRAPMLLSARRRQQEIQHFMRQVMPAVCFRRSQDGAPAFRHDDAALLPVR